MSSNLIMLAASAAIVLAPAIEPTRAQVSHMHNFENNNDAFNRAWTFSVGSSIDKTKKVSGESSVAFTSGTAYLTVPQSANGVLGTQDFTMELWFNTSVLNPNNQGLFTMGGQTNCMSLFLTGTGRVGAQYGRPGVASNDILSEPGLITVNQWNHLAVTRKGNLIKLWLNGRLVASVVRSMLDLNGYYDYLGWAYGGGNATYFNGNIDMVRVTRGVAIYEDSFAPPTAPFVLPA